MMEAALLALDDSALSREIAASRYTYPLLNAAHILGLATLFGSIVILDLRLLGLFQTLSVQPFARAVPRVAACGLLLAVLTGTLLFTVEPLDYVANAAFRAKIAIVTVATAHALYVHSSSQWKALVRENGEAIGLRLRASALLSVTLWGAAILAGRLIAF